MAYSTILNTAKMDAVLENIARDQEKNRAYAIWRPARLSLYATTSMTLDEIKTAELYKKVRGILNKLTPEKFESLLNQVRALSIDNDERLQGVVDLVFEKAVSMDEPNFSFICAFMCKELALMQVPTNITKSNKEEQQFVNFRKLLINRCQTEFEKNLVDENVRNLKLKEIDESTDLEKKKKLQALLEEEDRRMHVKSVRIIRFIGELFKQQMLTVKIILRCINILLDNKDEYSLECLCTLLTTVGKDLELAKNQNLQYYFNTMQEIVDKKHGKISNRVRFLLQDVIELRNSKWVSRRQNIKPKTMRQIQKESDTEQHNVQVKIGPHNRTTYAVESSKLMNKSPPMDEITLGSKNLFGNWGRGSTKKTPQPHSSITINANMYAASENIAPDHEKNRAHEILANDEFMDKLVDNFNQRLDRKLEEQKAYYESAIAKITADYKILEERLAQQEQCFRRNYMRPDQIDRCHQTESRLNKDPLVCKDHSMKRSGYKKNYEGCCDSRNGSQHRNDPATQQQKPVMSAPAPFAPPKQQLNAGQLKFRMHIMEEYFNDCCTLKEYESDIEISIDD